MLLYFVFLSGGIICLLWGLFLTRLTWRADVEPYGLRNPTLEIMLHPERFARPERLREIRALNIAGLILIAAAVVTIVSDMMPAARLLLQRT